MKNKIITFTIALSSIILSILFYDSLKQYFFHPPMEEFRLGIADEPLAALAIIAHRKRYFINQDIKLTIKNYKGGKQALINGLLSNEVDMATTADVPIIFSALEGYNFKIVASIASSDNEPRVVARKDRQISQPEDLTGKNIATKKGSAVHFFLDTFLTYNQIAKKDLNISFTDNGQQLVTLLTSGEIDAFSHREPFIGNAIKSLGHNAIVFEKPGAYTKTFNLVVSNDFARQRSTAIKRVLRALLMAEDYAKTKPSEAIKLVAEATGTDVNVLQKIWSDIDLKVTLNSSLISTLEAESHWAINNHLTDSTTVPNYLEYINPSFLQSIKNEAIDIN